MDNGRQQLLDLDEQIRQVIESYHQSQDQKSARPSLERLWKLRKQRDELQEQLYPSPVIPEQIKEDTYRGEHEAPDHTNGSPLWNLSPAIFPPDFYTGNASQYGELGSYIASFHNRPNAQFVVYRAIPKSLPRGTTIKRGLGFS